MLLMDAPAYVADAVKLPVCVVTVEATPRASYTPNEARSVNALDDTQLLISVDDDPMRVVADVETMATCAPTTVTLWAPVDARLAGAAELGTVASYDTAPIKLPTCSADVLAITRVHHEPVAVFDVTLEDDTQVEDTADVDANRARRLSS